MESMALPARKATKKYQPGEALWNAVPKLATGLVLTPAVLLASWALDWHKELVYGSLPSVIILAYGVVMLIIAKLGAQLAGKILAACRALADGSAYAGQVSKERAIIIDDYRLNKPANRGVEAVLSVGVWAVFINLLQPIVTVIMWLAGVRLFETEVFSLSALESTTFMMKFVAYWGAATFAVLFSWATWNYLRFGRLERRKPRPVMTDEEVAMFYNVPLTVVEEARELKIAVCAVDSNGIRFIKENLPLKGTVAGLLMLLMLFAPLSADAASNAVSLSQLGYDQDIVVTGAQSNMPVSFPLPRLPLLSGSAVNLVVEPGRYLNDASTFTFYLNDRPISTYSAGQLKARPTVQLPLPPDMALKGAAQVSIAANVFVTDKICVDYKRGYLTYTVRNTSAVTFNYNNPAPKTVAEFLATITRGLAVVIPDNPTPAEITAGAWAYGILQRYYPYLPVKLAFEKERAQYQGIPRILVAAKEHLPAPLAGYADGVHLLAADTLLITAEEGATLGQMVRQLTASEIFETIPSASINMSVQQQAGARQAQDKVYFGNNTAQSDILTVGADFKLFPALLDEVPGSLKIRLQGRYSPSNITGKPARLDVYVNRTLIHSELLDDSGTLDKEVALPPSLALKARNDLGLEFIYPLETANCKVSGTSQSVQILKSSYFQGAGHLSFDQFTWPSIGVLFNKNGTIIISDYASADVIRSVAETVVWLNRQLPVGVYAFPDVKTTKDYKPATKPAYLLLLGLVDEIPEAFHSGIPLQRSKNYTVYTKDDQSVIYRYQPAINTVLGQIGHYQGIPLISISANLHVAALPEAIRQLQPVRNYDKLAGDIFVYNSGSQLLSIDSRSARITGEEFAASWVNWLKTGWYKVVRQVERYQKPLLWGLGVFSLIVVGKLLFGDRGRR
jgi:poly-beta-1,6-N-acetyl-D-glucosamine biosynthesis protein PgaD